MFKWRYLSFLLIFVFPTAAFAPDDLADFMVFFHRGNMIPRDYEFFINGGATLPFRQSQFFPLGFWTPEGNSAAVAAHIQSGKPIAALSGINMADPAFHVVADPENVIRYGMTLKGMTRAQAEQAAAEATSTYFREVMQAALKGYAPAEINTETSAISGFAKILAPGGNLAPEYENMLKAKSLMDTVPDFELPGGYTPNRGGFIRLPKLPTGPFWQGAGKALKGAGGGLTLGMTVANPAFQAEEIDGPLRKKHGNLVPAPGSNAKYFCVEPHHGGHETGSVVNGLLSQFFVPRSKQLPDVQSHYDDEYAKIERMNNARLQYLYNEAYKQILERRQPEIDQLRYQDAMDKYSGFNRAAALGSYYKSMDQIQMEIIMEAYDTSRRPK